MTKEREKGRNVPTYTSKRRFCFSSKKKSRTNFLTKSGFNVLSITSVRPNWGRDREETQTGRTSQHHTYQSVFSEREGNSAATFVGFKFSTSTHFKVTSD